GSATGHRRRISRIRRAVASVPADTSPIAHPAHDAPHTPDRSTRSRGHSSAGRSRPTIAHIEATREGGFNGRTPPLALRQARPAAKPAHAGARRITSYSHRTFARS